MGNLEQISISAYPQKITKKYPKSTLEHKLFYQNRDFVKVAFLHDMRFFGQKNA